jgi:hypothetical protein
MSPCSEAAKESRTGRIAFKFVMCAAGTSLVLTACMYPEVRGAFCSEKFRGGSIGAFLCELSPVRCSGFAGTNAISCGHRANSSDPTINPQAITAKRPLERRVPVPGWLPPLLRKMLCTLPTNSERRRHAPSESAARSMARSIA